MGRRSKKKSSAIKSVIALIVVLIIGAIGNYTDIFAFEDFELEDIINMATKKKKEPKIVEGKLEMHTIDVGQGDSILFLQGDKVMLVDCGPRAEGETVVNYLEELGIEKIDILIGTHPHEDHMGGMAEVINEFEIGVLYTSDFQDEDVTTTYYMNFLEAVEEKNANWEIKKSEDEFTFGEADVTVLAPEKDEYDNANNYSMALMVSFGETDIMLTGDAEKQIEEEILDLNYDIECEIFKAAHHGSDTSNTEEFLEEVNPEYVVISAGYENSYNHPMKSVMKRFKSLNATIYRTDESGSIVMTTDGTNIEFDKEEGSYMSGSELVKSKKGK